MTSAALFNGGFESNEPCVLLPLAAARKLYPAYPHGTVPEAIDTAGGPSVVRSTLDLLEACIASSGRKGPVARVRGIISNVEREILISDSGIEALGVEVVRPARGLWRFVGEKGLRRSARPREW